MIRKNEIPQLFQIKWIKNFHVHLDSKSISKPQKMSLNIKNKNSHFKQF